MKNGKMQAKDIDDRAVLAAVKELAGPDDHWAMRWDLETKLGVPEKVLRAKCDALIKRKLLDGCTCGCRGDFELTRAGEEILRTPQATDTTNEAKEK